MPERPSASRRTNKGPSRFRRDTVGGLLGRITSPADVRALSPADLDTLASEIRTFLVQQVSRRGGHLGPNLGVVELTLALHRVFDSPADPILFDTGHQAYVHKIVTGRAAQFEQLRTRNGLSGYPSRAESVHDWVENSHASTSLSYADGLAKAFAVRGETNRTVVAVIGDGAMTGGMAWEALNNIAAGKDRPLVIILNDNGRSYAPTIGGMAQRLATVRLRPGYERLLDQVKNTLPKAPLLGRPLYSALHAFKTAMRDWLLPPVMFSDLGLKYLGPIDGHNFAELEEALTRAKGFRGPVVVHVVTQKGQGYPPAENDDAEQMHSPPAFNPLTGLPVAAPVTTWTSVFGRRMVEAAEKRSDLVAITAAMSGPTGLDAFARAFPARFFDVGIAEQHALTSAAGLAMGGLHPVVALYATFLNRGFDQLLMDCALHGLGVTVMLDRAGITGEDGPSHHGMWDMSIAGLVPGLSLAAPRDAGGLVELFDEAIEIEDGPTIVRYPKGIAPLPVPARRRVRADEDGLIDAVRGLGAVDILAEPRDGLEPDVLLVSVGAFGATCVEAAARLADQGIGVTVVDPRWVLPVPAAIGLLAATHRMVVTVEDGGRSGGVGAAVTDALAGSGVPVTVLALPQEFMEAASRHDLLEEYGLTARAIARGITEQTARRHHAPDGARRRSRTIPRSDTDSPGQPVAPSTTVAARGSDATVNVSDFGERLRPDGGSRARPDQTNSDSGEG